MINVYINTELIDAVLSGLKGIDRSNNEELSIEIIDNMPLTGQITLEGDNRIIKTFARDEMRTNTQLVTSGVFDFAERKLSFETEKDTNTKPMLALSEGIVRILDGAGIREECRNLDPDKSGVLLKLVDGQVKPVIVSGGDRPDLLCHTLFGGTQMCRPYADEIMDAFETDLLPIEEKIRAAEKGDVSMMDHLVLAYLNGDDEVEQDPEKAVYWMRKMADAGNANGMFNLGLHYAKGFGVERNFDQAAYWMEQAERHGDEDAAAAAETYRSLAENRELAEEGDAQAQAEMARGMMEIAGSLNQAGPGEDMKESFQWAEKSAAQDNGDGIWTLALCYEHGRGVEQDTAKAVKLYERGAALGHAPSQHSLACYYLRGDFLERDAEKGFKLAMESAEQGYGLAFQTVGSCYQFGNGVNDDMAKAIEWYEKSLEVIDDPELAQKVELFKMLEKEMPQTNYYDSEEADHSPTPEEQKEEYEEVYRKWQEECEQVYQKREEKLAELVKEEETRLIYAEDHSYQENVSIVEKQKTDITEKLAEAEKKLSELGGFSLSEKRKTKKLIEVYKNEIAGKDHLLSRLLEEHQNNIEEARQEAKKANREYAGRVENEFPLPERPERLRDLDEMGVTPVQIANERYKKILLQNMEPGRLYSISELTEEMPFGEELSMQRVSALVRQLRESGKLSRFEERRKAFFKLTEEE